jgi:hypothetical protein
MYDSICEHGFCEKCGAFRDLDACRVCRKCYNTRFDETVDKRAKAPPRFGVRLLEDHDKKNPPYPKCKHELHELTEGKCSRHVWSNIWARQCKKCNLTIFAAAG